MTSLIEGMPRVIVEANNYGIPVVSYDSYISAKEIIIDGKSGSLVKPGDKNKFVAEMNLIINN